VDGKQGPAGPKGDRGPAGSDLRTGARDITALLELPEGARLDNAVLRRVGDTVELSLAGLRIKVFALRIPISSMFESVSMQTPRLPSPQPSPNKLPVWFRLRRPWFG
jgi:hypothetical protein